MAERYTRPEASALFFADVAEYLDNAGRDACEITTADGNVWRITLLDPRILAPAHGGIH